MTAPSFTQVLGYDNSIRFEKAVDDMLYGMQWLWSKTVGVKENVINALHERELYYRDQG